MYFSDIIKQQLKHDAPYAWFLKENAKNSPLFRNRDIELLDERLQAYIDCFALSKRAGDNLLDMLKLDDWGSVFVTTKVALECDDSEAFTKAVEATKTKQQANELSQALSLYPYKKIKNKLQKLITHKNPLVRVASIQTLNRLKIQIETKLIKKLLSDKDIEVKIEIIKLIGSHKLIAYQKDIEKYLNSENEELRFETAYTGSILQSKKSLYTLREFCFTQTPYLRRALTLIYYILDDTNVYKLFQKVATKEFSPRIKAYNLAMAGFVVEAVPTLLEEIKDLRHSLFGAEAISFMTGVDLEEEDLAREENLTEEEEKILLESQKADKETQDYEEDLALPDVELLTKWWQEHKKEYKSQTRYLAGKTINEENLKEIIEKGTQPQIAVAKLILRLRYKQNIELSNDIFSLKIEESTGYKNRNRVTYAPKTGDYQATLPKGHFQSEALKLEPFAYNYFKKGEAFSYSGLEDFDVEKIVWVLIS